MLLLDVGTRDDSAVLDVYQMISECLNARHPSPLFAGRAPTGGI